MRKSGVKHLDDIRQIDWLIVPAERSAPIHPAQERLIARHFRIPHEPSGNDLTFVSGSPESAGAAAESCSTRNPGPPVHLMMRPMAKIVTCLPGSGPVSRSGGQGRAAAPCTPLPARAVYLTASRENPPRRVESRS